MRIRALGSTYCLDVDVERSISMQGLQFDLIVHSPQRPLDGFFRDLESCHSAASPSDGGGDGRPTPSGGENTNRSASSSRGGPNGENASQSSAGDGVSVLNSGGTDDDRESPPLDGSLLAVSGGQLARAREAATAAVSLLLLTDAVLLYPPGQLALAAMRTGFRKAREGPRAQDSGTLIPMI